MWWNVNILIYLLTKNITYKHFLILIFFYRHLHYTGHIKNFIIVSEEAIAKGIRRIVALTGPEAIKAQKKTSMLQNYLDELQITIEADKNGINTKEHIKKIIELTDDVSHAIISSWKKVYFIHFSIFLIYLIYIYIYCIKNIIHSNIG